MQRIACLFVALLLVCCSYPGDRVPDEVVEDLQEGAVQELSLPTQPSGFLLGSPVAITTRGSAAIQLKEAGFTNVSFGAPAQPDFASFVRERIKAASSTNSPILAMSLGLDVLYVNEQTITTRQVDGVVPPTPLEVAVVQVGAHGWVAFEFSVDSARIRAEPVAPILAPDIQAALDTGMLDRTVFSYLVPGSDALMLPSEWQSVRAMDPGALGLTDSGDEIYALDMHMALYGTDLTAFPEIFTQRVLRAEPTIYFTLRPGFLTAATAQALQREWMLPVDSWTIYRSQWQAGKWGEVSVFLRSTALGLPAWGSGGEGVPKGLAIDGLAIDMNPEAGPGAMPEIMFSLTNSSTEEQVLYAKIDPTRPPKHRRVVIQATADTYGSLGVQLQAGRGVGDFCAKDPEIERRIPAINVPDDYFVARRLWPRKAFVSPYALLVPLVLPPPQPARLPGFPAEAYWVPIAWPLPELALAVSGYRQWSREKEAPFMRTCMSWPFPKAMSGTAKVQWGTMTGYWTTAGETIMWDRPITIPYLGEPLVADKWMEGKPQGRGSVIAQWTLTADGKTYISPISALRN